MNETSPPDTPSNQTSPDIIVIDGWGTPEQFGRIVDTTAATVGVVSFFASIIVITYWLHSKSTRKQYSISLVGCLAIWDLIMEIGHCADHVYSLFRPGWASTFPQLCTFFGITFYFGFVCTWLWTLCISLNLVWLLFQKPRKKPNRIKLRYLLALTVGSSFFCTTVAAGLGAFGETLTGNGARFCLFLNKERISTIIFCIIPLSSAWGSMTFLYSIVVYRLTFTFQQSDLPPQSKSAYRIAIRKSLLYPFLFFFVWCCPYIWANWWFASGESRAIVFMTVLTTNMSGTCNCIGYFLVSRVFEAQKSQASTTASATTITRRESRMSSLGSGNLGSEKMSSLASLDSHVVVSK